MFSFTNCSEDPQTVRTVSVWCSGTRTACLGVWTTFFSRTLLPPRLRLLWQPSTLVVCLERWWAPRGPPCETEVVREELEGSKTTSDRGCVYVQTAAVKRVRLTYGLRSREHRRFPPSFPPVADIAAVRLLLWVSYCGAMATGHAQSELVLVRTGRVTVTLCWTLTRRCIQSDHINIFTFSLK